MLVIGCNELQLLYYTCTEQYCCNNVEQLYIFIRSSQLFTRPSLPSCRSLPLSWLFVFRATCTHCICNKLVALPQRSFSSIACNAWVELRGNTREENNAKKLSKNLKCHKVVIDNTSLFFSTPSTHYDDVYLGETMRFIADRAKEHVNACSSKQTVERIKGTNE